MNAALIIAFSAGMVATINPCGFAMLPAYLSYFMGINDDAKTRPQILRSAIAVGAVVSAGFVVVFGVAGIVISAGFRTLAIQWLPWLALGIGVLVALLGVAMLAGYELRVGIPSTTRSNTGEGWSKVFGFGMSYGIASLSCTLPVFLVTVATQLTQRSFAGGVLIFAAYTVGMSVMLLAVTVVLALGKQSLLTRIRAAARYINRVSGAILVLAGGFIVWFWVTDLSSGAATLGESAAFRAVEGIQSAILNFIADNIALVAIVISVVVAATAAYVFSRRPPSDDAVGPDAVIADAAAGTHPMEADPGRAG